MKVLITGASGFLGGVLYEQFQEWGFETYGTYLTQDRAGLIQLDIRDKTQVDRLIKEEIRPELVIHTAGISSVEACQNSPLEAFWTNVLGTISVTEACRNIGARLVYPSSSYVFDGTKERPYLEYDRPHPLNVYGHTKMKAEYWIQTLRPRGIILRSDMLYGFNKESSRNGFFGLILDTKRPINVENTNIRQPLYVYDAGQAIFKLIEGGWLTEDRFAEDEYLGIVHLAGPEVMTTYGLAEKLASVVGKETSHLNPVQSFSETPRPPNTTLDTTHAQRDLSLEFTPLEFAIRDVEGRFQSKHPESPFSRGKECY